MACELTQEQQTCCQPGDLLCVSIPCTTTIQLLGLNLNLGPVCLRLFSGTGAAGTAQATEVLNAFTTFLGSLGTALIPKV